VAYGALTCGAILAFVFGPSALAKIRTFDDFAASVRQLRILPALPVRPLAAGVVAAEALVPVLLLIPVTVPVGFCLAAVLLTAFGVATVISMRRGTSMPCPCFGATTTAPLGSRHLVRNALLLAACAVGLAGTVADSSEMAPAGTIVSLAGAGLAALLVIRLDDLIDLFAGPAR
jgi:hypothetical protein